jgi:site-specific DNA-methyltransferase (adenine-specific)
MPDGADTILADRIIIGDAAAVLNTLPAGCADLVVADPPFNFGLDYGDGSKADRLDPADYLAFTDRWLAAARRVLSPAGAFWVQITPRWAGHVQVRLEALGLTWRNSPVWCYKFGPHQRHKFAPCHQQLFYFTAEPGSFTFNADEVRVPSDRQVKYRDRRANPAGRVPGDVWTFKRIAGTHRERRRHVCQTPEQLLERVVRACTNPGDLVLDPFAGSGTTLAVAKRLGRRFLGIEKNPETAARAEKRLLLARDLFIAAAEK